MALRGAGKSEFAQKLAMFESGKTSSVKVKTEKFYSEDAGLVTNQARRFLLDETGVDATVEEAFEAQSMMLAQFEAQKNEQSQDDIFAKAYEMALNAGLNDEEALEQATAMSKFQL
ncbi:MAG: hypothetical protein AB7D28_07715 [Candidatus Berkiella sp.]